MALVTLADFKTYAGTTSTGSDDLLQACLDAGEREVLNFCKRSTAYTGFEESTGLTRYYRAGDLVDLPEFGGKSGTVLWLGDADLLSVDSLTNGDGTAISSTGYWLEPRNRAPYRCIRLKTAESWQFDTDGEIAVTGSWGYSTGPDAEIVDCVKQTAKYKLDLRASQTYDVTASPEIGVITIPKGMPANVRLALKQGGYVRSMGAY
jgi:hypothetical protein